MTVLLGIFAREPVAGRVKKRLAREIGDDRACAVYTACLRRTLRLAGSSGLSSVVFCAPPNGATRLRRRFKIKSPILPQRGRTLGSRMDRAFASMFRRSGAAILIGSDSPTMPPRFIRRAAKLLRSNDFILGPAEDGGYYLIGLTRSAWRRHRHRLFYRIRWGDPAVFQTTRDRARRASLAPALLPIWFDIDTAKDLKRAPHLLTSR